MHVCDVKNCVRPSHLKIGTQEQNNQEIIDRYLLKRGVESPRSKFSDDDSRNTKHLFQGRNKPAGVGASIWMHASLHRIYCSAQNLEAHSMIEGHTQPWLSRAAVTEFAGLLAG